MDELVNRVGDLKGSMSSAKEDINAMRPVTEDVRKWKLMGIGALGVTFADVVKRLLMLKGG